MKKVITVLGFALWALACADEPKAPAPTPAAPATSPAPSAAAQKTPVPLEQLQIEGLGGAKLEDLTEEQLSDLQNPKPGTNIRNGEPILLKAINLTYPIRQEMVQKGLVVYDTKCASCHILSGNGSKASSFTGITKRRDPVWIMNMTTGVKTTLDTDAAAQRKLDQCPVRSPLNRLSIEQARDFLELVRYNDGER